MKKILFIAVVIVGLGVAVFLSNPFPARNDGDSDKQSSDTKPPIEDPLKDGSVYTHALYSLRIPEGFRIEVQSEYSTLFYPSEQSPGPGPANFIYVSVIPQHLAGADSGVIYNYNANAFQKLAEVDKVGESTNIADLRSGQEEWYTYTLVAIDEVDGMMVKRFENTKPWEFPQGTTESRYIVDTGADKYLVGYYTGGDSTTARIDPRTAYAVVKSFKVKGKE